MNLVAQMDNLVSTTDLRRKTKRIVGAAQGQPQIIISNSKPIGVLLSPSHFKELKEIAERYEDYIDSLELEEAVSATKEKDFISFEEFKRSNKT